MLGRLMPCGGGAPVSLHKARLLVGRERSCDVLLGFTTVSPRHCELQLRDGYWLVRDLGSTNGTRVNGKGCAEQWLFPGDVLHVGNCRFRVLYTPPPDRPPPRTAPPKEISPSQPKPKAPVSRATPGLRPGTDGPSGPAEWSPSLWKLIPCGGGAPIPLDKPKMVVGRHRDCDIILPYGFVSKHHCELEWQDGAWSVRDLDSLHGIGVNGATCSRNRLEPGSILSIASLRYQLVSSESGPSRATVKGPSLVFGQSLLEKAGLAHWQPGSTAGGKGKADDDQGRQRYTLDLEGS